MVETLERLRELYNAALQERRDAYRATGKSPNYYAQAACLIDVRSLRPEYAKIHTHLLQDALKRLDRAFVSFFRRCKAGDTPGYPRFKGRGRYKTFTFAGAATRRGAAVISGGKRLRITGVGNVKIKMHRPYGGLIRQIGVTLDGDGCWYALISCNEVAVEPLPKTGLSVGVDLGVSTFAAMSDGSVVENPRYRESAQSEIARAHRKISRRKRGSRRRHKARVLFAKRHCRVANSRKDFHHKVARELVRRYDVIAIENLNIRGFTRGMLAGPILDVAWGQFVTILANKAESAGRELVRVDPRGTSQVCSACECEVKKDLSIRIHDCPHCGYVVNRDVNAARNIERRGHRHRGGKDYCAEDPRSPLPER